MRASRLATLILAAPLLAAAVPVPPHVGPLTLGLPGPILRVAAQSPDQSRAEDMDALLRLGLMEGHLMVGHDLLAAHQEAMALPHFGHPARELYDDLVDYLNARKFPAFDSQLVKLESAVASAPYAPETEVQYRTVIDTVHRARDLAPASLRASVPAMIKVCADTLDVASGEYNGALEGGRIEPIVEYHDSRGYVSWVSQMLDGLTARQTDPASQATLGRMRTVLAKAWWIVEPLLPGAEPRASAADYRAVAAEAAALAKD